jgi:hypothetical protein
MNRISIRRAGALLVSTLFVSNGSLVSCSKQSSQQHPQQQPSNPPAPAAQPAQPAPASQPQTAPNVSAAKPAGPLATEKHTLALTDFAQAAVTATLNRTWVGQWDNSVGVPLDTVLQGRNELKIDLAQTPGGQVTVEVYANRDGQNVNLLRLNFQGKPTGSYTYYFAPR